MTEARLVLVAPWKRGRPALIAVIERRSITCHPPSYTAWAETKVPLMLRMRPSRAGRNVCSFAAPTFPWLQIDDHIGLSILRLQFTFVPQGLFHIRGRANKHFAPLVIEIGTIRNRAKIVDGEFPFAPFSKVLLLSQIVNDRDRLIRFPGVPA